MAHLYEVMADLCELQADVLDGAGMEKVFDRLTALGDKVRDKASQADAVVNSVLRVTKEIKGTPLSLSAASAIADHLRYCSALGQ